MKRQRPFRLAPGHVSDDVVEALQYLLDEAKRGEVLGIAYVAQLKQRSFIADTAGEAHRNPLFSIGMVRILEEGLVQQVRFPEAGVT